VYNSTQHLQSNAAAITPKPSDHAAPVETWSGSESGFPPCSTGRAAGKGLICVQGRAGHCWEQQRCSILLAPHSLQVHLDRWRRGGRQISRSPARTCLLRSSKARSQPSGLHSPPCTELSRASGAKASRRKESLGKAEQKACH